VRQGVIQHRDEGKEKKDELKRIKLHGSR
jgi:hypothetical protein